MNDDERMRRNSYEYDVVRVYDDYNLKEKLVYSAKEGWRAIKIYRARGRGEIGFTVVFERSWLPQSGS